MLPVTAGWETEVIATGRAQRLADKQPRIVAVTWHFDSILINAKSLRHLQRRNIS
jgi:nitroimidazol reductase NimA-like FMN-containing flavoprotein (pyridoxamine 5'-phosphate oxidase superfamily)